MKLEKRTFITWEKLRILYVLILASISIFGLFPIWKLIKSHDWLIMTLGAIFANIFYTIGPLAESYLSFLGVKPIFARIPLFLSGTIFSAALVFWYFVNLHTIYIGRL